MDEAYRTHEDDERCIQYLGGIILKWILKKWCGSID
jgi:hypothetical protein